MFKLLVFFCLLAFAVLIKAYRDRRASWLTWEIIRHVGIGFFFFFGIIFIQNKISPFEFWLYCYFLLFACLLCTIFYKIVDESFLFLYKIYNKTKAFFFVKLKKVSTTTFYKKFKAFFINWVLIPFYVFKKKR